MGESFIGDDKVTMILGDNIFEDNMADAIKGFSKGAMVFAKEVPDPERFGVVEFDETGKALTIEEKPKNPRSNWAVTGLYTYDNQVVEMAKNLKPSERGEIEITDLNNIYLKKEELTVNKIKGAWLDAGTHDALLEASAIVKEKGISRNFDPLINEAIDEFSLQLKNLAKATLEAHNLILRK
jgi:glucose-1-phosphate thymidylyltransferase